MPYYSIVEIYNNNGIFEFNLEKDNKSNSNNVFSKELTLVDQNILISIEQNKKIPEICVALRNKTLSPLFYLIERFYQCNESTELLLKDDIPRFNKAYKQLSEKINVYKDRSIKNDEFIETIKVPFSMSNIDNGFYRTHMYLEFFYTKAAEFTFTLSNNESQKNIFNAIKLYDFSGVSRFVIMITVFSIFSAGHNAFFYKFLFPKSKNNSSPQDKAKNSFGDIRYLLLLAYLTIQMECQKNLCFKFVTGDENLSKIINALKFKVKNIHGLFEYKIESLDIKKNLDNKLLNKNDNTYSAVLNFFNELGITVS
ncbi:hypothetical protein CBG46_02115 [Actinobacillus succinogenes]|nr:hypothetical protein [Actinobacillus succinogenes]PHI39551.1 hypothetical protein CBG46_02115 [Actinobacillus succinogenes]